MAGEVALVAVEHRGDSSMMCKVGGGELHFRFTTEVILSLIRYWFIDLQCHPVRFVLFDSAVFKIVFIRV